MTRRTIAPDTPAETLRETLEGTLRFIWQHNGGEDDEAAKTRAIDTIALLKDHLVELGVEPSLTRPLDDILDAFAEAERGRMLPLFMPKAIHHRPPLELSQLSIMTRASLAIDLLMEAKQTKEKAAREVVKKLREYGIPIGGKLEKPEWKTVVGWREKLRKAHGHPDVVWCGSFYRLRKDALLRSVEEDGLAPRNLADRELESLDPSRSMLGQKVVS
jgi:hypothetical protein